MPSTISRRVYGLQSATRRSPASPTTERPLTPADELSSWLPDELCVACGTPVKASQLYCSERCRQQEQIDQQRALESARTSPSSQQYAQTTTTTSEPALSPLSNYLSLPPVNSAADSAATSSSSSSASLPSKAANTSSRQASEPSHDVDPSDLRYPCPPSPHLIAHRRTTPTSQPSQAHLGPFEKTLLAHRAAAAATANVEFEASSSSSPAARLGGHRRDGAHDSTDSSACESTVGPRRRNLSQSSLSSAVSTDPSTPSPAIMGMRKDADEDDELSLSEFRLPPLLMQTDRFATTDGRGRTLRRTNSSGSRDSSDASSNQRDGPGDSNNQPQQSARRRGQSSSAHQPASASLWSPVLQPRRKTRPVIFKDDAQATLTRQSFQRTAGACTAVQARGSASTLPDVTGAAQGGSAQGLSPSQAQLVGPSPARDSLATATGRLLEWQQKQDRQRRGTKTFENIFTPQLSSVSSAATITKVLSALSPGSGSSTSSTKTATAEVCGRPGCSGVPSLVTDSGRRRFEEPSPPSPLSSSLRSVAPAKATMMGRRSLSGLVTGNDEATPPRPVSRHKHTHSAMANFNIHNMFTSMKQASHTSRAASRKGVEDGAPAADEVTESPARRQEESASVFSPQPRGRSKARGQRSTSRRSRSPPRAAARGRRGPLQTDDAQRKAKRPANPESPPLDAVKPRSNPIDIVARNLDDGARALSDSDTDDDTDDVDESAPSSPEVIGARQRGRSPIERRRRVSAVVSNTPSYRDAKTAHAARRSVVFDDVEGAVETTPKLQTSSLINGRPAVQQPLKVNKAVKSKSSYDSHDPGFDEIDLELEA